VVFFVFYNQELKMQITIQNRFANSNGRGARAMTPLVRASLEGFFEYVPEEVGTIDFVILSAKRGSDPQRFIKVVSPLDEGRSRDSAVSVNVWTEGTQGALGLLSVEGYSAVQLEGLLERGPYNKKPRRPVEREAEEAEAAEVVTPPVQKTVVVTTPQPQAAAAQEETVAPTQTPRLTPLEKLQRAEVPPEEIDRLKETLSAIVHVEVARQGFAEVPSTLRVSVETITRAILDHMKLAHSRAGNYQGIVGSFYASKISLFALKYDYPDESVESKYPDWLFDCPSVIDFVGGHNQLVALARVRKKEVEERVALDAVREPAPEPQVVEQAAQEGFMPDNSLFALAHRFVEGREQAALELALSNENLQKQQASLNALLAQVELAQQALAEAFDLVKAAQKKVDSLVLSDAAKKRIFQAKAKLDALVSRLG
jgi:hypothetical protein